MRSYFTSYIISLSLIIVGVVCLAQASNPNFLVSADQIFASNLPGGFLLYIAGILLVVLGGTLLILRFVLRSR